MTCRPRRQPVRRRDRCRRRGLLWLLSAMTAAATGSPAGVRAGEPDAQTAILEAVRQDLVRQRLEQLTVGIEGLMRDLKSNGMLEDTARTELDRITKRVQLVSDQHVHTAAQKLRQAAAGPNSRKHLVQAEGLIDLAAREIGGIMLRLGVKYATEVFGTELHEVLVKQEALHVATMDADEDLPGAEATALVQRQREIADWLNVLLAKLAEVRDYQTDALATVRLSRVVSMLRDERVETSLHAAADDLEQNAPTAALSKQHAALMAIMKAEFRIRPGAELKALVRARNALQALRGDQRELRDRISRWDATTLGSRKADAARRQVALRRRTDRVLLPPILEEQLELAAEVFAATGLETAMSDPVSVEELVTGASARMDTAVGAIDAADADATAKAQMAAEASLHKAILGLQQRIEAAMHLDIVFRRLQEAQRRLEYITGLIEHQQELRDEAEQTSITAGASRHLAVPQDHLATETDTFSARITRDNDELETPSKFVPTVCRQLGLASSFMRKATGPLKDNAPAEGLPHQDQALHWLGKARETAEQEVAALERLWRLLQAVKDLEVFAQYLADLEAEQRQLRTRTQGAGDEAPRVTPLAKPQQTLSIAVTEVKDILAGDPRLTALGGLLDTAKTAMSSARTHLSGGRGTPALPHQKDAADALRDAQAEVRRLAKEFDFLAEWIEFLKQLNADALDLLQRQIELRMETQSARIALFGELAGEQDILRSEAVIFSELFPVGQKDYAKAAAEMKLAIAGLNAKDRDEALRHMALAEEALTRALEQLLAALEALDRVPLLSLMSEPPEELALLTRILVLSAQQRSLRRKTRATRTETALPKFADPQEGLRQEARSIAELALALGGEEMPLLTQAESEMGSARDTLRKPQRDQAIRHQQLAEKYLRQLLLELALENFEMPKKLTETMAMAIPQIMPPLLTMEAEHAFAREAIEGEFSSGGRTEWRILGRRDRAALNQNFARELPLEYRDVLRVYFERLSE
ncbi:MAG: hypothetical protein KGY99_04000 [Phycisphaerae bacterium]|nr:hypothetical protein [Phycisphaerae bacterium]